MRRAIMFATALATALVASPASIRAAPDQTLGMAIMSASVIGTSLIAGSGVVSIDHPGTGTYDIKFNRGLQACTCTAGFMSAVNGSVISAVCANGTGNNVRVSMLRDGTPQDFGFQLIVFCPK